MVRPTAPSSSQEKLWSPKLARAASTSGIVGLIMAREELTLYHLALDGNA